jgi:2-polyprenyl-3-methyl-5-hydroxy-6-metoxy-1,4-benzoquinol methylase
MSVPARPVTDPVDSSSLVSFACDLCGAHDEDQLYTKRGSLTGLPFQLVRCRRCGLLYLNPRLTEAATIALYDAAYYEGRGFDPHVTYVADHGRDSVETTFRPREVVLAVDELIRPPARILDLGCGLGDFMRISRAAGYQTDGYEVSPVAAAAARRSGGQVFESLDVLPNAYYDVVTAIEVLEHCTSPTLVLTAAARCLKPGGIFYYTTENFDKFYERWKRRGHPDRRDGYVVPEGHIHFFSPDTMRAYFTKVGFGSTFTFVPQRFDKGGRLWRMLTTLRLVNPTHDRPKGMLERIAYRGGQATMRLLRRRRPLPMARR